MAQNAEKMLLNEDNKWMSMQRATFSKSLNPRNIDKSVSDIQIRIRFLFESSFRISVSGCKLTILLDIQPANRIVIISGAQQEISFSTKVSKKIVPFQQEFPIQECDVKKWFNWTVGVGQKIRLPVLLGIRIRLHPKTSDFLRLQLRLRNPALSLFQRHLQVCGTVPWQLRPVYLRLFIWDLFIRDLFGRNHIHLRPRSFETCSFRTTFTLHHV